MSRKEPKTLRVAFWSDGSRWIIAYRQGAYWWMDLSRICAAPSARLSHLPFKSDRAFPAQC
ncbi:DUF6330 family protein [Litoreibacter arenae]|uniref:DUF6330 family protein n=1 Tax=Litoreibacter arenae TaxID=491388 RepID=UPI0009F99D50|nr:DUF6330 family protein [Litoreibacter arenae]